MTPGDYERMILSMPERVRAVLASTRGIRAGRWRYILCNIAKYTLRKVARALVPSKRSCPPQSQPIATTPIPAGQVDCIPVEL
jgi:hypothetical protein